ncbi:hypothetical protein A1O3_06022 [Capronia epimyces CBS 606.96]|uniref:Lysosomal dipeptide transporter MFSD1 n=1 Tax=Capronia epimyces CBS 606.96 TaxID=1182542 RepID=W9YIT5_9EURO|nr:uncharacterized protein A1O3_06022 [Capronia epimyces CBS 606.96]EXJ82209.1 hypothetical protein A1O3_06022 [Capronia epimyces CBS 606.96]
MTGQLHRSLESPPLAPQLELLAIEKRGTRVDAVAAQSASHTLPRSSPEQPKKDVPVLGFGSQWSSDLTGVLKSTLKKELKINNTQFSLLESSEDFTITALMLVGGIVTDRIGGASAMLYGNAIYTVGSILVAAAAQIRSYKFMVAGRVVRSLGGIATQVAQHKVFSSWFAPNDGFASTLGFELGMGNVGAFAGKASANIIAKACLLHSNTGDFAWVFWVAVFMNLLTNMMTGIFYWFTKMANRKFQGSQDPATGEMLNEKNRRFELRKVLELPWMFWCIQAFSLFETSTVIVFLQNATELAEQRFSTSSISAGWYSAALQYAGCFIFPLLGIFLDMFGNRLSVLLFYSLGVFTSMCLVRFASHTSGTAASFGVFGFTYCFGLTTIIDSIRTSMWHSSVFGSAYSLKFTMNNAVITGAIQDRDNNVYDNVTIVYLVLAACSVAVSLFLIALSWKSVDLGLLQWTRKQRISNGATINERKRQFYEKDGARNRLLSKTCFGICVLLVFGSWGAYFWGIATENHD